MEQLSQLLNILDEMSTTSKVFPLQGLLRQFQFFWDLADTFFGVILGNSLFTLLFYDFAWGGFCYASMTWSATSLARNREHLMLEFEVDIKHGLILTWFYLTVFVGTIVHQIHADNWVPYIQEPTWLINVKHKQQISAGTFFIVYLVILTLCYFRNLRGHENAIRFVTNKKLNTYVFLLMSLENLASFSDFPWFLDQNNNFLNGYEEIFQEQQTLTSTDKIYHFAMSSVAAVMLLSFIPNPKKSVAFAISIVLFWELFEISLNPNEISDSGLDMLINSSAILMSTFILLRIDHFSDIT